MAAEHRPGNPQETVDESQAGQTALEPSIHMMAPARPTEQETAHRPGHPEPRPPPTGSRTASQQVPKPLHTAATMHGAPKPLRTNLNRTPRTTTTAGRTHHQPITGDQGPTMLLRQAHTCLLRRPRP